MEDEEEDEEEEGVVVIAAAVLFGAGVQLMGGAPLEPQTMQVSLQQNW